MVLAELRIRPVLLVSDLVHALLHLDLAAVHRLRRHLPQPRSLGMGQGDLWMCSSSSLPYLGVFVYVIARGHKMQEHAVRGAQAQDQAMRQYVQSVAPGRGARLTRSRSSPISARKA